MRIELCRWASLMKFAADKNERVLMMQTLVLMGRRLPREEWPCWEGLAWHGVVELHRC